MWRPCARTAKVVDKQLECGLNVEAMIVTEKSKLELLLTEQLLTTPCVVCGTAKLLVFLRLFPTILGKIQGCLVVYLSFQYSRTDRPTDLHSANLWFSILQDLSPLLALSSTSVNMNNYIA